MIVHATCARIEVVTYEREEREGISTIV
jgi:hypothetical protein